MTKRANKENSKNLIPSEQEVKWALGVKEAALADPEINAEKISDLEFLQHALVAKEKIPDALQRIKRLERFKRQYGIQLDGSLEEAERDLRAFHDRHAGFYLALGELADGTHVQCANFSAFDATKMHSDESFAVRMRGLFYYMQACQPNVAAMRAGYVSLVDFGHASWSKNFSLNAQKRTAELMSQAYPMRVKQIVMLNAGWVAAIGYRICKRFFSAKIRQRIVVCSDRDAFLDCSFYTKDILPAEWGGSVEFDQDALSSVVLQKLQERYALMAKFEL